MKNQCPVCEATSRKYNEFYMQCVECGLLFSPNGKSSRELFTEAYLGHVSEAAMGAFADRMVRAPALHQISQPGVALTTSAHQEALELLKKKLAPGSTVLDIGCSTGVFLRGLQSAGFKALGCDIAKAPVDFLKDRGFQVYCGSVGEYPSEWAEPQAVTSFFVLHHVENPVDFIKQMRSKFPHSLIIISEYFDKGVDFKLPQMRPPRTLSIWTPKSLERLFIKAGYREATARATKNISSEVSVPLAAKIYPSLRRFLPPAAVSVYFKAKRLVFSPYALWLKLRHRSYAVLAIAEPD